MNNSLLGSSQTSLITYMVCLNKSFSITFIFSSKEPVMKIWIVLRVYHYLIIRLGSQLLLQLFWYMFFYDVTANISHLYGSWSGIHFYQWKFLTARNAARRGSRTGIQPETACSALLLTSSLNWSSPWWGKCGEQWLQQFSHSWGNWTEGQGPCLILIPRTPVWGLGR